MAGGELWRQFEGEVIENKYRLVHLISSGSYGGVFLADHVVKDRLIRRVAVKLMTPEENAEGQLRELIEATNLHHPHLLRCFDAGQSPLRNVELFYLVMEVATDTLAKVLHERPLSVAETREWLLSAAAALEYLHAHKMVHCDVKPANMLRVGDTWKLSDFGLLRPLAQGASIVKTRSLLGSAAYMPPEGYDGIITPAWDVWSLGITLVEAMTQHRPFQARTEGELQRQILQEGPWIPDLPEPFGQIAWGCLIKDYRSRATLPQLRDALRVPEGQEAAAPPPPVTAPVPPPPPPETRTMRTKRPAEPVVSDTRGRKRALVLWALALLPVLLLGAILFHPKSSSSGKPPITVESDERAPVPSESQPRRPSAVVRDQEPQKEEQPSTAQAEKPRETANPADNDPPKPTVTKEPADTAAANPAPSANEPADRREEQGAVYALLDDWVDSTRNMDLTTQVNCYAPQVRRFYTKSNVSRDQVRKEKEQSFNDIDEIRKYDVRNVSIDRMTPTEAVVSFDKDWDMVGPRSTAGSERSRLTLTKVSGRWKIVGEEEVRVYWVKRQ